MEALSPEIPQSTSPPHNITIISHQHILPPIRNLPTWNRTNLGFKKRTLQPVQKNHVLKMPKIPSHHGFYEQCTQTSPTVFRKQYTPITPPLKIPSEKEVLENLYNKKILFLQSNHSEVLQSLHEQIEQLKKENKALKFSLVMTNGNLKELQSKDTVMTESSTEVSSLTTALLDTRNELMIIQEENKKLQELLQKYLLDTRPASPHNFKMKISNSTNKVVLERNLRLLKFEPQFDFAKKAIHDSFSNCKSDDDVDGVLIKSTEGRVTLRNKSYSNEVHKQAFKNRNVVLPRLNIAHNRNKSAIQNKTIQTRDQVEPIMSPVPQSLPIRHKRAPHALQMKRKRSNKNVSLTLSTSK